MVKNFVCRTCLTVIHSEDHAHNINEGNITRKLKIKTLVLSYISEIDLEISENPVICNECLNKLTAFHSFKNKCINMEKSINSYLKSNKRKGLINLEDVIKHKRIKRGRLNISNVKKRLVRIRKSNLKNSVLSTEDLSTTPYDAVDEKLSFMKYLNLIDKSNDENYALVENKDKRKANYPTKEVSDCSINFNFNKSIYIPLKDCMSKNCEIKQTLPAQNHADLLEDNDANVVKMIFDKEEVIPPLDNLCSMAKQQDLTITLKREMFFYCNYCSKCFLNEDLFQKHNRINHKVCRLCNFTSNTFSALQKHLKLKHRNHINLLQNVQGQNLPVNCCLCTSERQLFSCNLRDHRLKNHIKSTADGYICPYIGCKFTEKIAYMVIKHIEQEHDNDLFQCPLCNFKTNSVNKIKRHLLSHNERIYKCEVCWKGITTINALENHLRRMHPNYLHDLCMKNVFQEENHRDLNISHINYSEYLASDDLISQGFISTSVNVQLKNTSNPKKNPINNDDCIMISDTSVRPVTIVISDEF